MSDVMGKNYEESSSGNNIVIINKQNDVDDDHPNNDTSTEEEKENANVEKAVRFWKHNSLRNLPTEQKFAYLRGKGVTDAQIHKAWDRIMAEGDDNGAASNPTAASATTTSPDVPQPANPPTMPQSPALLPPNHHHTNTNNHNNNNNMYSSQPGFPPQYHGGAYHQSMGGQYAPRGGDEEDGPMSMAQGVSLVTLGGMLGLTAAAAVRWLNGGDFQLLPSATNQSLNEKKQQQQQTTAVFNHGEAEDDDDVEDVVDDNIEYDDDEDEEDTDEELEEEDALLLLPSQQQQKILVEKIENIADTFQSYVSVQEKILQKLSSSNASSITNSSMDLLRSSTRDNNNKKKEEDNSHGELRNVWAQLVEIKAELRSLHLSDKQNSELLGPKISNSLLKLETCLETVNGAMTTNNNNGRDCTIVRTSSGNGKSTTTKESMGSSTTTTTNSTNREQVVTPMPKVATKNAESASSSSLEHSTPTSTTPKKEEAMISEGATTITDTTITTTNNNNNNNNELPSLRHAVEMLAVENDATALRIGCQILYLYFVNLSGKPDNARYRKIYTSNESFQKVEKLKGAKELLFSVGFQEKKGCLEWLPDDGDGYGSATAEQEILFLPKLKEGTSALGVLKSGGTNLKDAALAKLSQSG